MNINLIINKIFSIHLKKNMLFIVKTTYIWIVFFKFANIDRQKVYMIQ